MLLTQIVHRKLQEYEQKKKMNKGKDRKKDKKKSGQWSVLLSS